MKKVAIILGTRPEVIKMSPIISELNKESVDFFILHTGQHYSYDLDKVFWRQLELPPPKYNLRVGSGTHAEETGNILIGAEKVLMKEKPHITLVEGDTNSVLAGALASAKLHIPVGHVEAGLRSRDLSMPEELNRILTDHLSKFLFAPTGNARENLLQENISENKIFVTGNTIVDAIYRNIEAAEKKIDIIKKMHLRPKEYFLLSCHRQENVDSKERFQGILKGIEAVFKKFNCPILYPIHPRAKKQIRNFGLNVPEGLKVIEPLGYLEFLQLEKNARLVLTDSGGVQEETCVLNVPCVTLRDNTERPETLEVGSNILAGADSEKILERSAIMFEKQNRWKNPFGEKGVGQRIVMILRSQ